MAETVEQELIRKLQGASDSLKEVNEVLEKFIERKAILEKRVRELKLLIDVLRSKDNLIWNLQLNLLSTYK